MKKMKLKLETSKDTYSHILECKSSTLKNSHKRIKHEDLENCEVSFVSHRSIKKRKKRERDYDGLKDSNILESSTLKNSLKESNPKELEDWEVSFVSHRSIKRRIIERDSDGLKDSNILESSTLKNSHKGRKHKELDKCDVSFDNHERIKKQKKKERNSDGLKDSNILESSTLKNSHKGRKHKELDKCDVSFDSPERIKKQKKKERNSDGLKDSNILESSTLKKSHKQSKHKELDDCDVSFDSHQKIKKCKIKDRNYDGLKDSNILESSTLKNSHKESKHKELEDCEVSFVSHRSIKKRKIRERDSDGLNDSNILESSTLKNSHKGRKHKELDKCDVSFDSHERIKKQKKKERNSDGLKHSNILESSTLKKSHKQSKHKELDDCDVSFDSHQKIKNCKKKDRNYDGLKDSKILESSILKNSHKESKHKELEDYDVSFDSYQRIKKHQKLDRNFYGSNNSNILECEPSSLENSDTKEMKNSTSVSVFEDDSSDSDDLIDDGFFVKERYSPYDLDDIEEPVNFQVPPLHEKETLIALTKEEKNVIKSQGVEIKQGKFSRSEDDILRENYEEFCFTFKVNNPYLLFGIGRYRRPKSAVLKFLKAKHFYVRLGRNLNNRSLLSIYQRARILFNPFRTNKIQKCDEENIKEVMYYQKELGNKWTQIGALVEKSNLKVRKCFEWNSEDIKKGNWAPEEEDILIKAIHSLVKIPNLSGSHSNLIPWSKVADLVPRRNTSQCRLHWGECMAWEPDAKRKRWTLKKDAQLVDELISKRNLIVNEIDWQDVHKLFKDYAPSHMFLRKRFRKIKTLKKFKKILEKSGLPLERKVIKLKKKLN